MAKILIEITDLPVRFAEMLELVATGEEVVITENQVPRAKLVTAANGQRRIPELHPGNFQPILDFDDPLPNEFWLGGS